MFEINFTFVWQFINFFLLLYCLYRIGYKPVVSMMEKRRQTIQDNLEGAEKEQQAAETLRKEYETQLANARIEAQKIVETANRLSEKNREEMLNATREESERLRNQAEEQINQAREKAILEIRNEVVQLSIAMAEKVIAKELDDKRQSEIIEEVIGQIQPESLGNRS